MLSAATPGPPSTQHQSRRTGSLIVRRPVNLGQARTDNREARTSVYYSRHDRMTLNPQSLINEITPPGHI
jgi:hypothetical protein